MSIPTPLKRELLASALRTLSLRVFAAVLVLVSVLMATTVIRPSQHSHVSAATNGTLNFQARLQNTSGSIVPDGAYNIEFKLYSVSSGGSALWTEDYYDSNGVTAGNDNRAIVKNGYVTVNLGSQAALPTTLNYDQDMWLTMNIGGTTQTATPTYDGEMSPRLKMTASAYAFRAGQLAQFNNATGFTSTLGIVQPTGGNQTFQIQDQGAAGTYSLLTNASGVQLQASTPGTAQTGNINITGTVIAGTFSGNGSALTNLNASSLATGTVASSVVSGAYGNITGVGTLSSLTVTGAITGSNTIAGTTLNGTTGINTGAGVGTQRIDASGNLANIGSISASGDVLAGGQYTRSFTRTLPTVVNTEVDLGTFSFTFGGANLQIYVTVPATGYSDAKHYSLPIQWNGTAGAWQIVPASDDSGGYLGAQDYSMDINISNATAMLRLRRTLGSTAGTAYVTIVQQGVTSDAWTSSTATAAVTAPTTYYKNAVLSQGNGSVTLQGNLLVANSGNFTIGGQQVITSARVLQNVTTDAAILTSGTVVSARLSGSYTGITGTGALAAGSIAAGFGTIATGNTITGTSVNGTTGINTGAGVGTQRIDASGNLANIGTINATGAVTLGSTLNVSGATTVASLTVTGNASVGGVLTVTDFNSIKASLPANTVVNSDPTSIAQTPIAGSLWHDLFAFNRYATPTFEQYNGTTWNAGALNNNLFANKENQAITVSDGTTTTGARWTWNAANFSFSTGTWLNIGFAFTATAPNKTILFESSADGTTWTTRHTSTNQTQNATPAWFYVGSYGGDPYLRLTITTSNAFADNISTIRLLSNRWGNQGGGSEMAYPYTWDGSQNITTGGTLTTTGTLNVAGSGSLNVAGTSVLTSGRVLQNVTTDASILTSGTVVSARLSGSYTGITGTGALAAGSIAAGFGTIATGNTITGTTVNGTTGINTGAGAGTQRLDSAGALSNITGYTQSSGSATFSQNAADQFRVIALQAPTTDMVNISNGGFPITADAINGQQIDYYAALGNAAFQASAQRLNVTNTSATAGSVTNGLRIVATGAVAGTTNGIKIDNFTSGAGGASALYLGTGWKDLLSYNGTQLISGTGIVQNSAVSGSYTGITGTGALAAGSIASGFGTISTTTTITGTTLNGTSGINTGAGAGTQRIDASGNLLNVGSITASGTLKVGQTTWANSTVQSNPASTTYYKIATLPTTTAGTYDHIQVDGVFDSGWGSAAKAPFTILMGNRNAFNYKYTLNGSVVANARLIAYQEADGSVSVYTYHAAGTFTTITYNISQSIGATVYQNPASTTTAPTGTLVFDSSSGTYAPRFMINNSGDLAVGGTTFLSAARVLQNVTTDASILTAGTVASSRLTGSYTGITAVGTLTGLTLSGVISSTVTTGTAPLTVASTTKVANLNVDLLDGLDSTAFAAASGSASYIQNQNAGAQTTSNFWISGNGRADTSVLTPKLDTATAAILTIGETNASSITLGNTTNTTTVNNQLLVKPTSDSRTLGAEQFTSSFGFGAATNWAVSGTAQAASATHTPGSIAPVVTSPTYSFISGNTYEITLTLSTRTTGTYFAAFTDGTNFGNISINKSYTFEVYMTATRSGLRFTPAQSTADGKISNISIKQYAATTVPASVILQGASGGTALEIRGDTTHSSTFIGTQSGQNNAYGTDNTGVGIGALQSNVGGNSNVSIGNYSLQLNTTGSDNTANGFYALQANTTGSDNTASGYQSLKLNTTGILNSGFGAGSLASNTSGTSNTAIGYNALYANVTGSGNSALGAFAGWAEANGVFTTSSNLQRASAIGAYAQVQASDSIVLGSVDYGTKVGIGTTIPLNAFSVSPLDTQTGTVTRTNGSSILVGTGTAWTAAMVGDQIVFLDGTTDTVTGFTDATHVTMSGAYAGTTDASPKAYRFHEIGLQVTSTGSTYIQGTNTDQFRVRGSGGSALLSADTTNLQVTVAGGQQTTFLKEWGGASAEYAYSTVQTPDGGYAVTGNTASYGAGSNDAFLAKYDSAGTLSWSKTWGGAGVDSGYSIAQTTDGGYVIAGLTFSYGAGSGDAFLAKYDSAGTLSWSKTWGGAGGYDYAQSVIQTTDGGYAVTGSTASYGAGSDDAFLAKYDGAGNLVFNKTWGGTSYDHAQSVIQTSDGGYAITGDTSSYSASSDAFLAKYDGAGNLVFNKTWGGAGGDYAYSLVQTTDGGYAITGLTPSFGAGADDLFLAKYDSAGTLSWNKTWGGAGNEDAYSLIQTSDDGYAVSGSTASFGAGGTDAFLAKYDSAGNIANCGSANCKTPVATVGSPAATVVTPSVSVTAPSASASPINPGTSSPTATSTATVAAVYATALRVTGDGSYSGKLVVGGVGITSPVATLQVVSADVTTDALVVQQANGAKQTTFAAAWGQSSFGEQATSVVQTSDGGYATTGYSFSFPGAFLAKYDSTGTQAWIKTTNDASTGNSLVQTSDGGYAVAGTTNGGDMFLTKYDSTGAVVWNKNWGSAGSDTGTSLVQTSDGGYAVTGQTKSYGDTTNGDMYFAKFTATGTLSFSKIWGSTSADSGAGIVQTADGGYAITGTTKSYGDTTNGDMFLAKYDSAGTLSFSKTWGTAAVETGASLVQTSDGGYAVTGVSNNHMFIVKYNATGVVTWNKTFASAANDDSKSIVQTSEGGYIVTGTAGNFTPSSNDIYLAKYDSAGTLSWTKTWGSVSGFEAGADVAQTTDGGYVVGGATNGYGVGNYDIALVKFDSTGSISNCPGTCLSPTATVTSPAATVTSPAATNSSPAATNSSPAISLTSPAVVPTTIIGYALSSSSISLKVSASGNVCINQASCNYTLGISGSFGLLGPATLQGTLNVLGASSFGGNASFMGQVGIGTSSPQAALHIVGPVGTSGTPASWLPTLIVDNAAGSLQNVLEMRVAGVREGSIRVDYTGNLVLNPSGTGNLYLNYDDGSGTTIFGNGAGGQAAKIGPTGTYYGNGKNALQTSDGFLRLNQSGDFTSGVYTPGNLRTDGTLTVNGPANVNGTLSVNGSIVTDLPGNSNAGVCHGGGGSDTSAQSRTLLVCASTPSDYAEFYPTELGVEAGDVVATTPNMLNYEEKGVLPEETSEISIGMRQISILKKAQIGDSVFGVVSTAPIQVIGTSVPKTANRKAIALVGRVPIKVNNQGGDIKEGDRLAISTMPGYAKKATTAGYTVAIALEPFTDETGVIMAFVESNYYVPPSGDTLQGSAMSVTGDAQIGGSLSVGDDLNVSGVTTLAALHVTGSAVFDGALVARSATFNGTLTVNGHIVTAGNAPQIEVGQALGSGQIQIVNSDPAALIDGTDDAGTISVTAGTQQQTSGVLAHLSFATAFDTSYKVVISPTNDNATDLRVYVVKTQTGFDVITRDTPQAGMQYQFDYIVLGAQVAQQ